MSGSSPSGHRSMLVTFSGSRSFRNISSTVGIMPVPRSRAWLFKLESGERTGSSQQPKPGGVTSGSCSRSCLAAGICNDSCLGWHGNEREADPDRAPTVESTRNMNHLCNLHRFYSEY